MTPARIAAAWKIPMGALLGLISLGVVLVAGDLSLRLPMADGPRMFRQMVLLALPITLSTLLLPPVPDIHASLLRFRLHHWVTRGVFWAVMTAVCAAAWLGRGLSPNLVLFEMTSTLSVTAAALLLVPRFGGRMALAITGLSCAWLLYGAPLGERLGFGDLISGQYDHYLPGMNGMGWVLTVTSVAACILATFTTSAGTTGSTS